MMTLQQPALAPDQAVHEQFLGLLCQDEQFLRAEFEDFDRRVLADPVPAPTTPRQRGEPSPAAPRPWQPASTATGRPARTTGTSQATRAPGAQLAAVHVSGGGRGLATAKAAAGAQLALIRTGPTKPGSPAHGPAIETGT